MDGLLIYNMYYKGYKYENRIGRVEFWEYGVVYSEWLAEDGRDEEQVKLAKKREIFNANFTEKLLRIGG